MHPTIATMLAEQRHADLIAEGEVRRRSRQAGRSRATGSHRRRPGRMLRRVTAGSRRPAGECSGA